MAKKIGPLYNDIIGGKVTQDPDTNRENKRETKRVYKAVSVGLTADQLNQIETIAKELGQPRHAVIKYAVISFITRYEGGERPEMVSVLKTK